MNPREATDRIQESLKATGSRLLTEARALLGKADVEKRAMTRDELVQHDKIMAEFDAIEAQLRAVEQGDTRSGSMQAQGSDTGTRETRAWLPSLTEYRSLGTSLDAAGGVLVPPDQAQQFFDMLRPETVVMASGVRVIQIKRDTVLPGIGAAVTASFVHENVEIPTGDMSFVGRVLRPRKLAVLTRVANELLTDSTPGARKLIEYDVTRAMAAAIDAAFLAGNGGGATPQGLRNTASATVTYLGTDGGVLTVDDVLGAISRLETKNCKPGAIYMHPRDWANLKKQKTGLASDNRYLLGTDPASATNRVLFGVPVFLSSQIPTNETRGAASGVCSSCIVVDPAQIVIGRLAELGILFDASRYFEFDQTAVRATARMDIAALNSDAVEIIAGIKAS